MKATLLKTSFSKKLLTIGVFTFIALANNILNAQVYPFSDPSNSGNWVLNAEVSDEFDSGTLDEVKWQIQGKDGIYKSNFVGRQPSQFSPNNALVENAKLKIRTKWEPSFPFSSATTVQCGSTWSFENITTAAVISRQQFHYGYMEIKSKSANAQVTSSFWTTGNKSELDMFEMFGGPKDLGATNNANWKKRLKYNMISWDPTNYYYLPDGNGPAHTRNIQAANNTADAFHVYGFDWTPEYIKVYIDGVLHPNGTILKSTITNNGTDPDRWVTDVPYWLWFDSETFCWLGIPEEADLPVDYEIEYIRVWETNNLLDRDFFGFESSIMIDGSPANWFIAANSTANFSISTDKAYRWTKGLKFTHTGALPNDVTAFAPFKSTNIPAGNYTYAMKVFIETGSDISSVEVIFQDPWTPLTFDLTGVEKGKWVTISKDFVRNAASGVQDRPRIVVRQAGVTSGTGTMYIDDVSVNVNNALGVDDFSENKNTTKVYPNPFDVSVNKDINISAPNAKRVVLYNVSGAQLFKAEKTTEPFELPISNLKQGIYFISIISDTTTETKKIIIK